MVVKYLRDTVLLRIPTMLNTALPTIRTLVSDIATDAGSFVVVSAILIPSLPQDGMEYCIET